eukprot:15639626-Heterocapsa_arctica.AAC.1
MLLAMTATGTGNEACRTPPVSTLHGMSTTRNLQTKLASSGKAARSPGMTISGAIARRWPGGATG